MTPAPNRRSRRLMGEINVVPYIDVMLVLLIIFMVTAPLLTQGIKVDLPKAGAEPLPEDMSKQQPLVLSVDASGNFYLNIGGDEEKPIDADTVVQRVSAVLRREPSTAVLVKADRSVPYGSVVEGMVLLQESGAEKVGFITDPRDTPAQRRGNR
jgi:Cell division and transport-associated protein TolR (TC 2.C.1.2.1)